MGKKDRSPPCGVFVQGSLWVWSATSRGRPPDGGLALAVFHMVPRVPAAPNLVVHPPADLRMYVCDFTHFLFLSFFPYRIDSRLTLTPCATGVSTDKEESGSPFLRGDIYL